MMYLLLRDNKQSGPYSLDDLKTKGLKAYDLVWVEGKSAAWRYPSEINELSAFAPAVEEQPFDRFYKKPAAVAASSAAAIASQPAAVASPAATLTSQSFYSEEPSPATRKRTIYVTMPGGNAAPVTVRETVKESIREIVRPAVAASPIDDFAFSEPVAGRLDSRQDTYGNQTGELMPRSGAKQKSAILQPVLIGVGILVLLAGGIFIGLSIKETPGLTTLASKASKTASTDNSQHTTTQPLPVTTVSSPVVTPPQVQPVNPAATTQDREHPGTLTSSVSAPVTQAIGGKAGKTAPSRAKANTPGNQGVASQGVANKGVALPSTTNDSSVAGIAVVHREAVHRTGPADNAGAAPKINLASQVSVGTNKYEVGTFGGISNLQVTVANKSAYPLDLVVVEVQYIQANKKTYKTENLYFHTVGPGMELMQEAPKSPRGIRIEYKITLINSKELGLSESGL
jgi:hypothetical protein